MHSITFSLSDDDFENLKTLSDVFSMSYAELFSFLMFKQLVFYEERLEKASQIKANEDLSS